MVSNIRIYQELCKGIEECGICLSVCRREVFKPAPALNRKGYRPPEIAREDECTSCGNCMVFCPDLAVAVAQKQKDEPGRDSDGED
jgi:2-oxoglutarate ferredoxin oxidoreductase subunit delta